MNIRSNMNLREEVISYIDKDNKISLIVMIKKIILKYYYNDNIMLDAIEFFISDYKYGFCIKQDQLIKFGILTKKHKSNHKKIKRILSKRYNLIENKDYRYISTEVFLTYAAFFVCLILFKDSCKYASCYFDITQIKKFYYEFYKANKDDDIEHICVQMKEQMIISRKGKEKVLDNEMKAQLFDLQDKISMINELIE